MVSLQVLVARHRNTLASKNSGADRRAPRETTGFLFSENGMDLGILGDVDLAWMFWDREKRAQKIHAKSTPVSRTKTHRSSQKSVPESVPQNQESTASSRPIVPSALARSGVLSLSD